jgi:succinate dehydrogenase/fumarate reductase flavoprotein subunit
LKIAKPVYEVSADILVNEDEKKGGGGLSSLMGGISGGGFSLDGMIGGGSVYELPGTESTDATDKGEAKKVVKLIDALGTITKDSKEAVQKARNAYDKLTANDKVYVTNYDKLKKAEEKLQKLQKNSKE